MAFWSKSGGRTKSADSNPFRALNPAEFDRGGRINRQAADLQRLAGKELTGTDVVIALQTALGHEIADSTRRRNPQFSPEQMRHVIDQTLDAVIPGVREAAYIAADLPSPPESIEGEGLSEEQFRALTMRIVNEASKNNVPVGDSVTATAKALGILISVLSERPGVSADELIKASQDAVREFTRDAIDFRRKNR